MGDVVQFREPRGSGPDPIPFIGWIAIAVLVVIVVMTITDPFAKWANGPSPMNELTISEPDYHDLELFPNSDYRY